MRRRHQAEACSPSRDALSLRVGWRMGRVPVRVHLVEFARHAADHDVLHATRALDQELDEWQVSNRSMEPDRPGDPLPPRLPRPHRPR